ncbi:SDR family oxidoreductase [Dokdonella sp.]|uniref:SDR family NAD(P)-dependent oxidoreductase n=1 Tax=Dokdonella sp. TaxID=2291710 RepID=UPI002626F17A|nr:SDR family oxidoreductase [Dokdonella sp.]
METTHALVTGASAGIGAAFARELASRGRALVLTARRGDRLDALADDLRTRHDIDVQCIPCDLADPDAPRFLHEQIRQRGLHVDTLVNNAGYGVPGSFVSRPWQTHADFIQVLMTAPAELCHRLLPDMRARRSGRIVNVASLAGMIPAPAGHTLYAASKAYLIRFSQALALENRPHGVRVCALCPGFTYSEFHDVTGTREEMRRLPRWMWMDAEPVVREALAAVERGDVVHVSGRVNRLIKGLLKILPDRLALRLVERSGKDFRDSADAPAETSP